MLDDICWSKELSTLSTGELGGNWRKNPESHVRPALPAQEGLAQREPNVGAGPALSPPKGLALPGLSPDPQFTNHPSPEGRMVRPAQREPNVGAGLALPMMAGGEA